MKLRDLKLGEYGVTIIDTLGSLNIGIGKPISIFDCTEEVNESCFTFCTIENKDRVLKSVLKNSILVLDKEFKSDYPDGWFNNNTMLFVDNPRLVYAKMLKSYLDEKRKNDPFINYNEVIVYEGDNVVIHHGAVLGTDGFGFMREEDGSYFRFPHIGKIIIGDNVEIGANSVVNRGALGSTEIGSGTKIDAHVHIAHNVKIGKNCWVVSQTCVGGSAIVGDNVRIGMGAMIRNEVKVGNNAVIGMGAIVTKDVPEGVTVIGNPARPIIKHKEEDKKAYEYPL